MLSQLFPRQIDNIYRGQWLALWLFVPVVLLRMVMGFNSMAFTRMVATSADDIPLDSFGPAGSQTVVALFALLGLFNFMFSAIGVVALIRYRAMIPFVFLLFLLQSLAARGLGLLHPIASTGTPGASIGSLFILGLLVATAVGFVFSLVRRRSAPGAQ